MRFGPNSCAHGQTCVYTRPVELHLRALTDNRLPILTMNFFLTLIHNSQNKGWGNYFCQYWAQVSCYLSNSNLESTNSVSVPNNKKCACRLYFLFLSLKNSLHWISFKLISTQNYRSNLNIYVIGKFPTIYGFSCIFFMDHCCNNISTVSVFIFCTFFFFSSRN